MTFTPALMIVTNITQALPAVVTTEVNHNLVTGQVVRMVIPKPYGMQELANKVFSITVLSPMTYSLQYTQTPYENVDSRFYTPFTNVGTGTPAQANCIGQGATPILSPYPYLVNGVAETLPNNPTLNDSTVEIPF